MEQYIPKSAVVAEIEKLIDEIYADRPFDSLSREQQTALWYVKSIMSSINTLEVKEVNLEKELDIWRHNHFHGRRDKEASGEYLERVSQLNLAKHFFELGLKVAQKGEEV